MPTREKEPRNVSPKGSPITQMVKTWKGTMTKGKAHKPVYTRVAPVEKKAERATSRQS